jgi:hypothetical protein
MVVATRGVGTNEQFPKIRHPQDGPKCSERLLKNLSAMRNEQYACISLPFIKESLEIEGRHDRLPCSCGRYY